VFLIPSCDLFKSSYKPPVPTPLTPITQNVKIQKQWSVRATSGAGGQDIKLPAVAVNNVIFTDDYSGKVVAIDADTGKQIWKINTKSNLITGLAASQGMIFAGTSYGKILAISQKDGKILWNSNMSAQIIATPCAYDNILLAKTENGELAAFNIFNGEKMWSYQSEEPTVILRRSSSPQAFQNMAIAGFASGDLMVFNLYNGNIIWKETIAEGAGFNNVQNMVDIDATPKVVDGMIYTVTYHGRIAALDLKTGRPIWQHDLSANSDLAVSDNRVYVTDEQSNILAFDRQTGNVVWKQSALLNRNVTAPSVINGDVVVADAAGYVHLLDQNNGKFVGRALVSRYDPIINTPIVSGSSFYIYTQAGKLIKFSI
jgi:outer membrane protein assembly factor BamB